MYFYVTTAKGKRINHFAKFNDFDPEATNAKYKTINKGDTCLVFCNGTIGQGRISYNYAKKDAIEMLEGLIKELRKNDTANNGLQLIG